MKYLFSYFLVLSSILSYACSCANPGPINDEQYEMYDFIARGTIDGVEDGEDFKVIFFNVSHFYKGEVDHSGIVLNTPLSSASCGISPNVGEEWLIYASKENGDLHVSLCSRTIVLKAGGMNGMPERAREDLAFLDSKEGQGEYFTIGNVESIYSEVLNENRKLNIYLPEGYNSDTQYPVIYLLDGSANEDFLHVAGLLQFSAYSWLNYMPKSILVGISNVDRARDFTFPSNNVESNKKVENSGGSAAFIQFIETELKPFVESNYPVNGTDMLIGQSLGGLLATEILYTKPQMFDHYFIVSPSLWYDAESLLERKPAFSSTSLDENLSVFIAVGNEDGQMKSDAKKLYKTLKKKEGISVQFEYLKDEDHGSILHEALYRGFKTFGERTGHSTKPGENE